VRPSGHADSERAGERGHQAIDVLLLVERPERKPDRLRDAGLVDELHHDALLVPHPLYQRGDIAAARFDDDDARWRLWRRTQSERQIADPLEQTAAQGAKAVANP